MGLLQAGIGALSGVLADQWREYFYCDSMPENVLMTKGVKRTGSRNANTRKGEDNIITNGSIIAVNEGQCMMIVEQGAIVEFLRRRENSCGTIPPSPPYSTATLATTSSPPGSY